VRKLKKSLIIFNVTNKIWRNQIKHLLNTGTKKVLTALAGFTLLVIGMLSGYLLSNEILGLFLSGDDKSIYLLLVSESITISIIAFAIFVIVQFISPDDSTLSKILSWLPIKPFERKISRILPTFANITSCAMLFVVLLFMPSMFVRGISLDNIGAFVLCLFLQVLFCIMMLMSIYNILHFIASIIKVPFARNIAFTITVIISLIFFIEFIFSFSDFLVGYEKFEYNPLTLAVPIYLLFYNKLINIDVNYWVFIAEIVGLIFVFVISILLQNSVKEKTALKVLRFVKFPRSKFVSLVCKEVKLQFRNEENFLLILLLILGSAVLRVKFGYTTETLMSSICIALLSTFSSLSSFGMEQKLIPLYKQMGVKSNFFSISKLVGCVFSSLVLYLSISAIMFSPINMLNIAIGLGIMICANIVLYFAGVVVPIGKENSYTQGLSIFSIILIAFPAYYGINYITEYSKIAAFVIAIAIIIFLLLSTLRITAAKWKL
jgi:hypothetical protein